MEKVSPPTIQKQFGGIRVEVVEDRDAMGKQACDLICGEIAKNPGQLFCAATGDTPRRTYDLMVEAYRNGPGLFVHFRVLKLDEWGGLDIDHPATCEFYLQKYLVGPLNIGGDRYFGCNSMAKNPGEECRRMDQVMKREGPIDLCLLGLGLNGHLGLNEPGGEVAPNWHVAELSEKSLRHPMLQTGPDRPAYGLTAGMGDILRSKQILLLVSGASKKEVLKKMFERKVTTMFPASFLWLHGNVTVLCDREAARSLDNLELDQKA